MTFSDQDLNLLARRSRIGGVVSLVGVGIVFATIGTGVWQVRNLDARKAQLASDIQALTAQKASLSGQVQALKATNQDQEDAIGSAQLKIVSGQAPVAAAILSTAAARTPATVVKQVYFQARSADQTPIFQRCAQILVSKGYRVPKLQIVPSAGPKVTGVRYFHPEEGDEAAQLAADLGTCAGVKFAVEQIAGYEQSAAVKPHQFEVWFSASLSNTTPIAPPPPQATARR